MFRNTHEMNKKFDLLLEQIRISNQARFGQSSEKVELQNQLTFCFNNTKTKNDTIIWVSYVGSFIFQ